MKISNSILIENLVNLVCWGGGLAYGSVCRFELGEKIPDVIDGKKSFIGGATLWLEADDWIIKSNGLEIDNTNSYDIDRASFESIFATYFLNKKLISIKLDKDKNKISIYFEQCLTISIFIDDTSYDSINLFLPDGKIIYARDAFYLSEQKSEIRKATWQKEPLIIPPFNELRTTKFKREANNNFSFNNLIPLRNCYV